MGEVGAAFEADDEADVGGVAVLVVGGDGADVAVLEVFFGVADFILGDVIDGEFGDLGFDAAHGFDEGGVVFEVTVVFPLDGHFADFAFDADGAGDAGGDVEGIAAALVVVKDFFEVVHAGEVVAVAGAVAVAFELDHVEHVLGFVGAGFVGEHAGDSEGVFVESPAVHGGKVGDGGLDFIVHFEGVVDVGGAGEFAGDADGAFADGEFAPVFAFGFGDDGAEFVFAFEDGGEGEAGFAGGGDGGLAAGGLDFELLDTGEGEGAGLRWGAGGEGHGDEEGEEVEWFHLLGSLAWE